MPGSAEITPEDLETARELGALSARGQLTPGQKLYRGGLAGCLAVLALFVFKQGVTRVIALEDDVAGLKLATASLTAETALLAKSLATVLDWQETWEEEGELELDRDQTAAIERLVSQVAELERQRSIGTRYTAEDELPELPCIALARRSLRRVLLDIVSGTWTNQADAIEGLARCAVAGEERARALRERKRNGG